MTLLLRQVCFTLGCCGLALGVSCSSDSDSNGNAAGAPSAGAPDSGMGNGGSSTTGGAVAGSDQDAGNAGSDSAPGAGGNTSNAGAAGEGSCGSSCTPPSCASLLGTECQGGDCCRALEVPGGTFQQGEPDAFASTVDSFGLDELEVTVGRFRQFVNAYNQWLVAGNPVVDAGESANVPGSGWQAGWSASLPEDDSALKETLVCGSSGALATWAESAHDDLPINCVDWFTAFAFCIWDGGRLPTDAEAEYAAVGGSRDYLYPWGNTPLLTDEQDASSSYAVYLCMGDGSAPGAPCTAADLPAVGSRASGRGYYHQLDLVGSVWEWSLDWWEETYPTTAQTNYAKLDAGTYRTARGGSWDNTAKLVNSASRTGMTPSVRYDTVGFRCARNAR